LSTIGSSDDTIWDKILGAGFLGSRKFFSTGGMGPYAVRSLQLSNNLISLAHLRSAHLAAALRVPGSDEADLDAMVLQGVLEMYEDGD